MAIKTESIGTMPAVTLEYLQYNEFNMRVSESFPHKISVSARIRPYGNSEGEKIYAKDPLAMMNITNLDAYINGLSPEEKLEAAIGIKKVQEGLATLAGIYYKINIQGVE